MLALKLIQILTNLEELSFLTVLAFPKAGEKETDASVNLIKKLIILSRNIKQP